MGCMQVNLCWRLYSGSRIKNSSSNQTWRSIDCLGPSFGRFSTRWISTIAKQIRIHRKISIVLSKDFQQNSLSHRIQVNFRFFFLCLYVTVWKKPKSCHVKNTVKWRLDFLVTILVSRKFNKKSVKSSISLINLQ